MNSEGDPEFSSSQCEPLPRCLIKMALGPHTASASASAARAGGCEQLPPGLPRTRAGGQADRPWLRSSEESGRFNMSTCCIHTESLVNRTAPSHTQGQGAGPGLCRPQPGAARTREAPAPGSEPGDLPQPPAVQPAALGLTEPPSRSGGPPPARRRLRARRRCEPLRPRPASAPPPGVLPGPPRLPEAAAAAINSRCRPEPAMQQRATAAEAPTELALEATGPVAEPL